MILKYKGTPCQTFGNPSKPNWLNVVGVMVYVEVVTIKPSGEDLRPFKREIEKCFNTRKSKKLSMV